MAYGGGTYGGAPYGGGGSSLVRFMQTVIDANRAATDIRATMNAAQPWVTLGAAQSATADLVRFLAGIQAAQANLDAVAATYRQQAQQSADRIVSILQALQRTEAPPPPQGALYEVFRAILAVSSAPISESAVASVGRVVEKLESAQSEDVDPDAVAHEIETAAPEAAGIAHPLRQMKGWTAHQWILVMVAVLTLLLSALELGKSGGVSVQQEQQMWQQFEQNLSHMGPPPQSPPPKTPGPQTAAG
jgi:hypothetical protein